MDGSGSTNGSCSSSFHSCEGNAFSDSLTSVSSSSSDPQSVERSIPLVSMLEEYEDEENCDEFEEILSAEVHMEVERLRELSKSGIPHELRRKVWMYLLGVSRANRSEEVLIDWKMTSEYNELKKNDNQIIKMVKVLFISPSFLGMILHLFINGIAYD